MPHGDNEYSASGLFHLSGTRALDYQTLKHTIEMQPVPEKHFMCDFAIAVAGNPNQRVSSGGDSESSRLGADAIKVVIKEDEVSLGSDRLQGALLASGQDECPNGKEFLVDINSFDDLSSEYKIKIIKQWQNIGHFLIDKERKIATLTVANGKQKISSELSISEYYQIDMYGNAMRLSASFFKKHCYTTNISSTVQDCTNDMTNTDITNTDMNISILI